MRCLRPTSRPTPDSSELIEDVYGLIDDLLPLSEQPENKRLLGLLYKLEKAVLVDKEDKDDGQSLKQASA